MRKYLGPLTVRPSAIDNLRFHLADGGPWESDIEKLVADLKSEDGRPTPETEFGTEFHQRIHDGDFAWLEKMNVNNLDIDLFEPDIKEWRYSRTYEVDGREVVMSGQVDAIAGQRIVDYKTTGKAIDVMRYHDAMQWRCYLALHERCTTFRYEIFDFRKTRPRRNQPSRRVLYEHRFLELHTYAGLESDVFAAVTDYVRFLVMLEEHGWVTLGEKEDGTFGVLTEKEENNGC